ncbi:MAG: hypothetical protein ACE5F9_07085 [Phycisphaerae bacterium]
MVDRIITCGLLALSGLVFLTIIGQARRRAVDAAEEEIRCEEILEARRNEMGRDRADRAESS